MCHGLYRVDPTLVRNDASALHIVPEARPKRRLRAGPNRGTLGTTVGIIWDTRCLALRSAVRHRLNLRSVGWAIDEGGAPVPQIDHPKLSRDGANSRSNASEIRTTSTPSFTITSTRSHPRHRPGTTRRGSNRWPATSGDFSWPLVGTNETTRGEDDMAADSEIPGRGARWRDRPPAWTCWGARTLLHGRRRQRA
jgi:hypothetical protein